MKSRERGRNAHVRDGGLFGAGVSGAGGGVVEAVLRSGKEMTARQVRRRA